MRYKVLIWRKSAISSGSIEVTNLDSHDGCWSKVVAQREADYWRSQGFGAVLQTQELVPVELGGEG